METSPSLPPLLEISHLSKTFPGMRALDNLSLTVRAGEIVGLIGHNGSGKSTTVKILAGVYEADPGSTVSLGRLPDGSQAELHFIHQDLGLVNTLSTVENLDLDLHRGGLRSLLPFHPRAEEAHARELIAGFGVRIDVRRPVGQLSAAERTIIAIARALDGWSQPYNVLCLDEPTASLHGDEVAKLFTAVKSLARRGAGIIFVSHRLDEVVELADRAVVLREGKMIADAARGEFDHDDLVRLIAGDIGVSDRAAAARGGEVALSARGIAGKTVRDVDITVRAGEVVGVGGVLGSGRDEVASLLFGAVDGEIAELEVGGKKLRRTTPRRAIDAGMALVPSNRHRDGAVMSMTVRENLTLPEMGSLRTWRGSINPRAERAQAAGWVKTLELRPPLPDRELRLFSGGNQQKVVLAKWLRNKPRVLLLDEPTQGVDVGAKAGIYELIAQAAAEGAAVVICSSDDKELATCCDRVLVMRDGRVAAEIPRTGLSESVLVHAALGTSAGAEDSAHSDKESPR